MAKARMATAALSGLGKLNNFLFGGIGKGELAARLSMDALGGVMAAAYTPGDIGDKAIAGLASTIGGAGGGLVATRMGSKLAPQLASGIGGIALDYAGSIGGDIGLSMLGEQAMKAKSYAMGEGYLSPFEKIGAEQQAQMRAALEQDILTQYGIAVPGAPIRQLSDPTLVQNGLGG